MGNWGNWCCHGECWQWSDDFNRAAIGADWTVVSGTWSIDTNVLEEVGTAGAVIVTTANVSPTPFHHRVTILVDLTMAVGAKPRIIVNYVDASTYFYAEWEKTSAGNDGTLRLCSTTGGVLASLNTTMAEISPGWGRMSVCFNDELFAAEVVGLWGTQTDQVVYICDPGRYDNGNKAGIGNGAAIEIRVDLFDIIEIWPPKTNCPECVCTCEGECIPHSLTGTITLDNPSGGCQYPGLHGQTFPLTMVQGEGTWFTNGLTICGAPVTLEFGCTGDFDVHPGTDTEFSLVGGVICFGTAGSGNVSAVCDPLSIVFGPFDIGYEPPPPLQECACCSEGEENKLWITITE